MPDMATHDSGYTDTANLVRVTVGLGPGLVSY
jgi:hypothetical protein